MDSLRLFLLDQGIPVEYELDTFNTQHTGNNFTLPPKLAMSIAMPNLAPTPSPYFTSGPHFLETTRFSPKQPETQTANILPSHIQQHTLLSQLYHNSISSLYFFPFPRGLQHKSKLYIPCCHIKNLHVKANSIFVFLQSRKRNGIEHNEH